MRKLINEYRGSIGAIIIIICFTLWIVFRKKEIEQNGVYAIAKITKYRAEADGESLFVDIYIGNKISSTIVSTGCSNCVDSFFYVKVLRQDLSRVKIYFDSPVPSCIIKELKVPEEGWKEIPVCK
jgi:hypothetical protein